MASTDSNLALFAPPDFGPWRMDQADAVTFLTSLPAESVQCIVTDPPYESLEKHRKIGTTTRLKHSKASSNEWFEIFPNERFPQLFRESYRVLAKNSHLYMFCDDETMFYVKPIGEQLGFKFWKKLVWDYGQIGMGYHYRSRHQNILFFEKGKRKLADLGTADVINCPRVRNGYPTEKPQAVSEVLIRQSTLDGEIVCDMFSGSGSTGAAAVSLGRRFLGCDLQKEAVQIGRARLARAFTETMQVAEALA